MQTLHRPPVLTVQQIDERIRALHQHIQEWHQGHAITATPMQCRDKIDQLLDARHALTNKETWSSSLSSSPSSSRT